VTAPAQVGGLETVVRSLATGQLRAGHWPHVVAVLDRSETSDHAFLSALEAARIEHTAIRLPARAYRKEREHVAALLDRLQPDVVHTHGYRSDWLIGDLARRRGYPTVSTVHGFTGGDWKNRLYERLQRRALRRFSAVVAVSRSLRDELAASGVPAARLLCVPNAWEAAGLSCGRDAARTRLGLPPDAFVVGWVGRLERLKGGDVWLRALNELRDLPIVASMIGEGPQREELQRRAHALEPQVGVRWHGRVPNAGRLFRAFDAFVLSSRSEGTPTVLFEAMAAEVPIVATEVGGVPDVLAGDAGILVAPGDPAALASAVRALFEDPTEARCRAERGRSRLESEYAPAPWVEAYERIYRDVAERSRRYARDAG